MRVCTDESKCGTPTCEGMVEIVPNNVLDAWGDLLTHEDATDVEAMHYDEPSCGSLDNAANDLEDDHDSDAEPEVALATTTSPCGAMTTTTHHQDH